MNLKALKDSAKSQIKGKIGILFAITLIIGLITWVSSLLLSLLPLGNLIVTIIVTPAFSLSIIRVYLNVAKGGTPNVSDSFCGFDDFWSAFKVSFLTGLFTFL